MDIHISDNIDDATNYNVIHLQTSGRNNRPHRLFFDLAKCVYNVIQNVNHKTTKTIIIFDNFIKYNPTWCAPSICPENIFNIDNINAYFKKYNISFMIIPKVQLDILKIEYGLKGGNIIDITDKLKACSSISSDYFSISEDININDLCGEDPALGYPKKLYLHYKINDNYFLAAEDELHSKITSKVELDLTKNIQLVKQNIEILKIEYGVLGKNVIDITNQIKNYFIFNDDEFSISNDVNLNTLCNDPLFGEPKKVYIHYKLNNNVLFLEMDEHSSKIVNNRKIYSTPKIEVTSAKIENIILEYEENSKCFVNITEMEEKCCKLSKISFNIAKDHDIIDIPTMDVNVNKRVAIRYQINSNNFSILSNNCGLKLNKNLDVKLINEEENEIEQMHDAYLFGKILKEMRFVNFHTINAMNYLKMYANSSSYSKINIVHLMVEGELAPFYKSNKMNPETYKKELDNKYYSMIDKYLEPSPHEINIILSSEIDNLDLKEYMDFRLFNNVFIDKNCADPENVQILALLVGKSCNNIFIGNYDCNELKNSISTTLVSHIIPENMTKVLIDLHNLKGKEILL